MKYIIPFIITIFYCFSNISSQDLEPLIGKSVSASDTMKLSEDVYKIYKAFVSSIEEGVSRANQYNVKISSNNKIKLNVVNGYDPDLDIDLSQLILLGFETGEHYGNRCEIWIRPLLIPDYESMLPEGYFLDIPNIASLPGIYNQGPDSMNSVTYTTGGSGLKIAVIDLGYSGYDVAESAGAVPTSSSITYYGHGNGSLASGSQPHGTACVETIFDHAPNAEYYIHKIDGSVQFGNAIDDCIADGVDIISISLSYYNMGWNDDSGLVCNAVNNAAGQGALVFLSAGNNGDGTHVQKNSFNDSDDDNWYNWSGADELNDLTIPEDCTITIQMQFAGSLFNTFFYNYDIYLYDNEGNILEQSTAGTGYETLTYFNDSGNDQDAGIAVYQAGIIDDHGFEIFVRGCNSTLQYNSSSNNTVSPQNSTENNVFNVAAVSHFSYNSDSGTDPAMDYSSRGPTNNNYMNIDFAAPTNTTTVAYGGSFGGTSCSCPNAAGATAAFWSAHPFLSSAGVRNILKAKAGIYRDWGNSGLDNTYGYGGMYLYGYHVDNRYIYSPAFNISGIPSLPYYSVNQVDGFGSISSDLRMIHLDDNDVGSAGSTGVIDKKMLYKSAGGTVVD